MPKFIYVINSAGERESFSFQKVYRSARRVGASKLLAKKIATIIEKRVYPGITTTEIFKEVRKQLNQMSPQVALKFNLKEGIKKLGPTGFPFEKYIAEILKRNVFKVKINQYIFGSCCSYEIDFSAEKENLLYIGECKYRNLPRGEVHLETALANYARFLDIKENRFSNKVFGKTKIESLLVTNAKFTKEAIKYSKCIGVKLLGWNYPKSKGLEYLIDKQNLYPITILPSLKSNLANIFVLRKIMLAEDLLDIDVNKFAIETKISIDSLRSLMKEARILLERR